MCGIIGIVGQGPVNQSLYDGLTVLQHRGQDAAGIVTYHDGRLYLRKGNGLVRDVFRARHMQELIGNVGIGHVRYPTAGSSSSAEAQPFYVNSPFGITLGHNGNLINTESLKRELFLQDRRHINTESDSEVLLNIFAQELLHQQPLHLEPEHVFNAVSAVHRRCRGAYAAVAMINGHGIVAFRDPYGIRPVVYGMRETAAGLEYMVASESVSLDALGFKLIRDLAPGEAIYIDLSGHLHTRQCALEPMYSPCIFEYVYFARPDSIIDDVFVHKARMRMGDYLGQKIQREWPDHDIDVVIPIPETSRTSALELAMQLGVKYREGFIKNRYIARTFIMPGQTERRKSVRQKLNPIGLEFQGKNVLLVDDSIVRGTTSREIVMMARDAGARRVYFASASPPVRYPNIYGIDMPAAHELIAHGRTEQEVCDAICADRLIYQDLPDLVRAVQKGNPKLSRFDTAVFDGDYVTGVSPDYLAALEQRRAEGHVPVRVPRQAHIDLHNTV
ncbi:amidophosphoribosyltransferase [Acidihalobacter yilgarnensis]|uniref:Amidophosphoribosyltransferase n=1 Tax=Acidihalobacter yilgarnensis TaxID=2819280 RepID=A0A1D8IM11_9GAMM|nr:amidophosphoribosyltransferase [Acidihalobacter yilgarnensis]AOU97494.1 amidophosphoribosyltransferase [Acidihalobacter yilgarnensis]